MRRSIPGRVTNAFRLPSHAARALLAGMVAPPLHAQDIPPVPAHPGADTHVLALARAPDGAVWVGTYGRGIFVLDSGASTWRGIPEDTSSTSISWGFVHAFAFARNGDVWYGTLGNGWGSSADGGRTWRNWTLRQLGPEFQYVAPNGMLWRGDTLYVATADGVKLTGDGGERWHVITDSLSAIDRGDVWGTIGNQYVLAMARDPAGHLWVSHVRGVERSDDGGRTWRWVVRTSGGEGRALAACADSTGVARVRAFGFPGTATLFGTEHGLLWLGPDGRVSCLEGSSGWGAVQNAADRPGGGLLLGTDRGVVAVGEEGIRFFPVGYVTAALPLGRDRVLLATTRGVREWTIGDSVAPTVVAPVEGTAEPATLRHTWFARPIALDDQPYVDQTYRYGSTMGGNFQQHQGVEFNNGEGTPVHAIGGGVVAFAGPAERGALTVAIRHDRPLEVDGRRYFLFSTYYHNSELLVAAGARVARGDVISRVGNTGRATNDHLHLEVHVVPADDVSLVVDPNERFPQHTTNPELWIEPLPGTGVVAGRAWDGHGDPVSRARVYGLRKGEPQETPFSFAETYGDRTRGTPVYGEHFAVGDVPPGDYTLEMEIEGAVVRRRIRVAARRLTWVEFRPDS